MKAGAAWEFQLERWHKRYELEGRALVFRCHPEAALKGGHLIYVAKGPPDFCGFLSSGRGVVFDAKETTRGKLHFDAIRPHQASAMRAAWKQGAASFLAVRLIEGRRVVRLCAVPWSVIDEAYKATPSGSFDLCEMPDIPEGGWIDIVDRL